MASYLCCSPGTKKQNNYRGLIVFFVLWCDCLDWFHVGNQFSRRILVMISRPAIANLKHQKANGITLCLCCCKSAEKINPNMPKPGSLIVKLRNKDIRRKQESGIPAGAASSTRGNKQKSGACKATRKYLLRGERAQKPRRDRMPSTMSTVNEHMDPKPKENIKSQSAARNLVVGERMFSKSLQDKMVREVSRDSGNNG